MDEVDFPSNITVNDIKYLTKMGCKVDQKNVNCLSDLKKLNVHEDNEQFLADMILICGFNDKRNKRYCELGIKLAGEFMQGSSESKKPQFKKLRDLTIKYLAGEVLKNLKRDILTEEFINNKHKQQMKENPEYRKKYEDKLFNNKSNSDKIIELLTTKQMLQENLKQFKKTFENDPTPAWIRAASLYRKLDSGLNTSQKEDIINTAIKMIPQMVRQNQRIYSYSHRR